jgi:hypothetical protein
LRVLVVNEPAVADAINRLRGEWAERSGGELSAASQPWADVVAAKNLGADVIVFPSRYLGELCVRGWLRPVRPNVLESDEFNVADVFPVVRRDLMRWGGEVMALPLGVDFGQTSSAFRDHPGFALLTLAAPTAVTNEREGALFDPETMKPRIADSAFVKALERMAAGTNATNSEADSSKQVPVLGLADRMVAVSANSRNGATAFKLIAWLASADVSVQLARADEHLQPVRPSLASSSAWYDPALTAAERSKLAESLTTSLHATQCLLVPRIPGVDEYMAPLDEAVRAAVNNNVPAPSALAGVAAQWEKTTDKYGRNSQRQAYWKHLGIEP